MNTKVKKRVIQTIAVALIAVMTIIPNFGYIPTPWVKITVIHVPVIVMSMMYGKRFAIFMGAVFATSSLLANTFNPNPLSFLFSPFYKIGEIGGGWESLVICYVPRILMALGAALIYKKNKSKVYLAITSGLVSYLNTIFVIIGIRLFYIDQFAQIKNISTEGALSVLASLLMINGTLEAIVAGILSVGIVPRLVKQNNQND